MTRLVVNPGICGKDVTAEVIAVSERGVRVRITSNCEMVTEMGESLGEVDQRDALKSHVHSDVYQCASRCRLHAACPVPMAILKAIEVEAGFALPQPVIVQFETAEQK